MMVKTWIETHFVQIRLKNADFLHLIFQDFDADQHQEVHLVRRHLHHLPHFVVDHLDFDLECLQDLYPHPHFLDHLVA